MRTSTFAVALTLFAGVFTGCSTTETPEAREHRAITTERLEPYECGNITRLHTYGGVFLASQPQPEDFEQAKKGGVRTVINLRHENEIEGFDIDMLNEVAKAIFGPEGESNITYKVITYADRLPNLEAGPDNGGVDIVVLNSIEWWTGNNPMGDKK